MVKKYSIKRILAFLIALVMVFNAASDLVLSTVEANNSEETIQNTSEDTMAVATGSTSNSEYGTGFIFPGNYVFNDKNQVSFRLSFHILANGGLAWKYRLFRHLSFGRYFAYPGISRQEFSFKSSTKVVNWRFTTTQP